jgi:hypothetical protein
MSDAAATAATAFTTAFAERDFRPAAATLADDVAFRSPVLARPWRTRAVLEQLGPGMVAVFDDASFAPPVVAGDRAVLSWTGRVGALDAEGVLLLDVGAAGTVTDMAILVRPLTALQAVAQAMAAAVDPELLAGH